MNIKDVIKLGLWLLLVFALVAVIGFCPFRKLLCRDHQRLCQGCQWSSDAVCHDLCS